MGRPDSFFQEQVGLQAFDAIQLNHFKRVRFFLKNGLNPNLRDGKKRTLLMCACNLVNQQTALKFADLLLKYEARIELSDTNGWNALHHAILCGHEQLVSRFLELSGNFDVNSQDNDGNTALMLAIVKKNFAIAEQVVHALRKYDLTVDISNNQGVTPLIHATKLGEDEIAKCLVDVGKASEQIRDKRFRKTALEWARLNANKRTRSCDSYPKRNCAVHTSPPNVLRIRNEDNNTYLPVINHEHSLEGTSDPRTSQEASYKWPDLKGAYELYEQQLASSYRKSAHTGKKSPPPSSDSTGESVQCWRKTLLSPKLKQRRHTIALSRSLPDNLATKFLSTRHGRSDGHLASRSFSIGSAERSGIDHSRWASLRHSYSRRNSLRRPSKISASEGQLPSTAPGGLESSLLATGNQSKRRNSSSAETFRQSVSFQSLEFGNSKDEPSVFRQSRRSNMKPSESVFWETGGTSLPILEQEEDSEETAREPENN